MKFKLVSTSILFALTLLSTSGIAMPLRYDFTGADGASLIGLTEATYTVSGAPLIIRSGSMDTAGNFTPGGGNVELLDGSIVTTTTVLDVWNARPDLPAGLGLRSAGVPGVSGEQIGPGEGLLFEFSPAFTLSSITLSYFFGDGLPHSEDVRLFGDGVLLLDSFANGSGVQEIDLSGFGILSSLSITTRNCEFDCTGRPDGEGNSDFVVAYIDGTYLPIPEPGTLLLLVLCITSLSVVKVSTHKSSIRKGRLRSLSSWRTKQSNFPVNRA